MAKRLRRHTGPVYKALPPTTAHLDLLTAEGLLPHREHHMPADSLIIFTCFIAAMIGFLQARMVS